jgi:hypothetical protein
MGRRAEVGLARSVLLEKHARSAAGVMTRWAYFDGWVPQMNFQQGIWERLPKQPTLLKAFSAEVREGAVAARYSGHLSAFRVKTHFFRCSLCVPSLPELESPLPPHKTSLTLYRLSKN